MTILIWALVTNPAVMENLTSPVCGIPDDPRATFPRDYGIPAGIRYQQSLPTVLEVTRANCFAGDSTKKQYETMPTDEHAKRCVGLKSSDVYKLLAP